MFKRLFASAIVFGMAALAPPAAAQVNHAASACAERAELIDRLETRFHEVQLATGLQPDGIVVEIWASPRTGSWTIFLTSPQGLSCITASGGNWALGLAPASPKGVAG